MDSRACRLWLARESLNCYLGTYLTTLNSTLARRTQIFNDILMIYKTCNLIPPHFLRIRKRGRTIFNWSTVTLSLIHFGPFAKYCWVFLVLKWESKRTWQLEQPKATLHVQHWHLSFSFAEWIALLNTIVQTNLSLSLTRNEQLKTNRWPF